MGKRIVIEPCFNEHHLQQFHMRNLCDNFKPDVYIIAEGIFPRGPEDNQEKEAHKAFVKEYTFLGQGDRSFDIMSLEDSVRQCVNEYPNTKFYLMQMQYPPNQSTANTYYTVFTFFINKVIDVWPDDIIMPSEADMFFTEEQAQQCEKLIQQLKHGESFASTYIDFFESPKVQKTIRSARKVAFRYGDGERYKDVMRMFLWESEYIKKMQVCDLKTFHYGWLRPQKYFDMRIQQIPRDWSDNIVKARELIRSKPEGLDFKLATKIKQRWNFELTVVNKKKEEHPKHVWGHENFRYYYD